MQNISFRPHLNIGLTKLILGFVISAATTFSANANGVVFTTTNSASGNAVAVLDVNSDGSLTPVGTVPTGGLGTGAGLGSASPLTEAYGGNFLLTVNAGSNDITVFRIEGDKLKFITKIASGGTTPVSIATYGDLVYVLNSGGVNNITGFRLNSIGHIKPIPNSTQSLSGASVGPAQVAFTPDGKILVVTEKGTNKIDTFLVGADGKASAAIVNDSAGATPYGFAFDPKGLLVVTEAAGGAANATTASSYWIGESGSLTAVTSSVALGQTAACWAAVSRSGKYAWTTDTGSGLLTSLKIGVDGSLTLGQGTSVAGLTGPGSKPTEVNRSPNGKYLYVDTVGIGSIEAFQITDEGKLIFLNLIDGFGDPTGLVVR